MKGLFVDFLVFEVICIGGFSVELGGLVLFCFVVRVTLRVYLEFNDWGGKLWKRV